jgi:hypothetical protein
MKPTKTKAQIRAELDEAIASFEAAGGQVRSIDRGVSGNPNTHLFRQAFNLSESGTRTPVVEVVQAIESRKHPTLQKRQKPKRKLVTDDFGEPLRWVWED